MALNTLKCNHLTLLSLKGLSGLLLDGAARQALFSVILFRSVYLSVYGWMFLLSCKTLSNHLTHDIAYLRIPYGQTAGVCNILSSALCECYIYVSPS